MAYAVILGLLIFFSGWGIVFIINFGRAPAALDAESQETIGSLNNQLELPDKALADYLAGLLEKLSEKGKTILEFLLFHDEPIGRSKIKPENLTYDEVSKALSECHEQTLVESRIESIEMGMAYRMGYSTYYWIPSGFRRTLKELLYKET